MGLGWEGRDERRDERKRQLGENTYNDEHKVLQDALEMAVARDRNGAVDERPDEGPDVPWHGLRPPSKNLQTQTHAVDVGAVVGDDAEGENDEAELTKASQGREKNGRQQPADTASFVALSVAIRRLERLGIERHCGSDGQTEHLCEE